MQGLAVCTACRSRACGINFFHDTFLRFQGFLGFNKGLGSAPSARPQSFTSVHTQLRPIMGVSCKSCCRLALQRQGIICSMHAVQALLAAEKDMAKLRGVANRAFESLKKQACHA